MIKTQQIFTPLGWYCNECKVMELLQHNPFDPTPIPWQYGYKEDEGNQPMRIRKKDEEKQEETPGEPEKVEVTPMATPHVKEEEKPAEPKEDLPQHKRLTAQEELAQKDPRWIDHWDENEDVGFTHDEDY